MKYLFSRVAFYKAADLSGIYRESSRDLSRYPHSDVDNSLTPLNVCLCERLAPRDHLLTQIKTLCADSGVSGRIVTKGSDRCQTNVLGQALFKVSSELVEAYGLEHTLKVYTACLRWLQSQYPSIIILSAYVHLDEPGAGPHLHVNFLPVAETSPGLLKLSSSALFPGRRAFADFQDKLHAWATELYPLESIPRRQPGPRRRHLPLPEFKQAARELAGLQESIRSAESSLAELRTIQARVDDVDSLGKPLLFGGYKLTEREMQTVRQAVKAAEGVDYQLIRMQNEVEDYRRRLDAERVSSRRLAAKLRQYEKFDKRFPDDVCDAVPSVDLQAEIDRYAELRDMHNRQKAFQEDWARSLDK